MKKKLTTLLFGLLLAVGWTSNASAQALPQSNIAKRFTYKPMAVTPVIAKEGMRDADEPCGATYSASSIKDLKYTWTDASNVTHESPYVVLNETTGKYEAELVTDPYQMYGLLRGVYMEKKLPGPYYSAYKSDGTTREREVYYGGIDAGWDIPGETDATYDPLGNITITVSHDYSGFFSYTYYPVLIKSIKVMSGGTVVTELDVNGVSDTAPEGWTWNTNLGYTEDGLFTFVTTNTQGTVTGVASGGTFTIASSVLTGYHNVQVVIEAYSEQQYYTGTIAVNGSSQTIAYGTTPTTYSPSAWAMQATSSGGTPTPADILITVDNNGSYIQSITLTSGNTTIQSWTAPTSGTYADLPTGWYSQKRMRRSTGSNGGAYFPDETVTWEDGTEHTVTGGTIRIPAKVMEGYKNVTVTVRASRARTASDQSYVMINWNLTTYTWGQDGLNRLTTTPTNFTTSYTFPVNYLPNTYKPEREGYTALMVAIKNNNTIFEEPSALNGSWEFSTKQEIVNYLRDNVESIKLLTDGLRIGNAEDYSRGTVFNCDATVNKFFILGKGQARQKADGLLGTISTGRWPNYTGEEVPFDFMYEEFSPTTGNKGDQITDFYSEMMKGNVYNVVHDCASVIQQGHQFSLSGNSTNPEPFSFTGLNFFIPDYRLKYWNVPNFYTKDADGNPTSGPWSVDGRDMNPYILADANDKTGAPYRQAQYFDMWFGQYNQDYAPQIGIYRITLSADAEKVADYSATNRYYDINLDWTSSLNEMAGEEVPQKYVVYEVLYDENGKEYLDSLTTVTNLTEWSIKNFPQPEHSVTRTFIIKGWPTDSDHPSFIAWSNRDQVVIPGYNDFLALALNHYESDFVVNEEKNYYRNFLTVSNENEENALTVERITNGESKYTLFRYDMEKPGVQTPVADLGFQIQGNPATAKYVQFTVSYGSYGSQDQLRPTGQPSKYDLTSMGVLTTGDLCLHGNGDLIIQPSGPTVNFHSIEVKNGNGTVITSWTAESDGTTLPEGWKVSPGSTFELFDGVYYLEGHGYIYIPASVLGNNTDINVTINASADAGSVSRITVNDESKKINNGKAEDYVWTAQEVAQQLFDDGMVRMGGLPLVDQFTASTAKNDHPNRYGYVLKYKPGEEGEKTSGTVEVPVQKTGSVVTGYYTLDQLDKDTDRALTTDILTAEVQMSLSDINSSIYHYTLLGADKNVMPVNDAAHTNYISYLQQRQDFTYREMLENSPLYVPDNTFGYPAGPLNYYNEDEKTKGTYGNYKAYVPMVETTGYDRRWYEVQNSQYGDYLHNTYGAPIWKTGVGKIDKLQVKAERQTGKNGSTNWKDGNDDCSLYILSDVNVTALMPGNSNVEYEPYMFRIFVESPSGKLRGYKQVAAGAAGEGEPAGEHLVNDPDFTNFNGPICIYTEYVDGSYDEKGNFVIGSDKIKMDGTTVTFDMTKNANNWADNAVFGAVDAIINGTGDNLTIKENDLKIYVRFYYVAKGAALGHTPDNRLRAGGNEGHVGNASEGSTTPSGKTAVYELVTNGDVVSKTYINTLGQQSDKAFKGVNIVITRYSDGTVTTTKIVK